MATKLTEARQLGIYNDLTDSQKEFVQNVINEANTMNIADFLDFYDYVKTKGKWDVKNLKDETKFIKNLDANNTLPEQKIDFSNFSTDVFINNANNEKFKAMLSLSEDELREHSMLKGQNIDGLDLEGLRVAFGEALFTAKAKVLATYTSLSSIGRAKIGVKPKLCSLRSISSFCWARLFAALST